ncbi:MAG: hypothetical protein ACFFC7_21720 [Candidatus Hermodarchaeota archaeon]
MISRLGIYIKSVVFTLGLLYLIFIPNIISSSFVEREARQEVFVVNETFDLSSIKSLSYQFPLWLDWVGTHARVRIHGGVSTGRYPSSLMAKIILDGVEFQQIFNQKHSLQQHYSFHAESEYVLEIQPPVHPELEGVKTLHEFTVELNFTFSLTPQGTGMIKRIIFETFTPSILEVGEARPVIPLQEQFSWRITEWSFGSLFFSTPLFIPLVQAQNVSIEATVEFSGLALDGWQLTLEQEEKTINVRDVHTLAGSLEVDPDLPCILSLSVDPPAVSDPSLITVTIEVQGAIVPSQELSNSEPDPSEVLSSKTLAEVIWLVQLGLAFMPLLVYYRQRRVVWQK